MLQTTMVVSKFLYQKILAANTNQGATAGIMDFNCNYCSLY